MTVRQVLATAALCGTLLRQPFTMPAQVSGSDAHASTARTARSWQLACKTTDRPRGAATTPCTFTVPLHGVLDSSRLQLVRQALQHRVRVQRALQRALAFQVDVDSQGGELFAALEIGRLLRAEGAAMVVGPGASCVSACVFVLMGARERHISSDARVGLHRPALHVPQDGGPRHARADALVQAMVEALVLYAQQMHVPRTIIDTMMALPPDRIAFLSAAALAAYGIPVREEPRARAQALLHPGATHGR
jgi:hypothetical protein